MFYYCSDPRRRTQQTALLRATSYMVLASSWRSLGNHCLQWAKSTSKNVQAFVTAKQAALIPSRSKWLIALIQSERFIGKTAGRLSYLKRPKAVCLIPLLITMMQPIACDRTNTRPYSLNSPPNAPRKSKYAKMYFRDVYLDALPPHIENFYLEVGEVDKHFSKYKADDIAEIDDIDGLRKLEKYFDGLQAQTVMEEGYKNVLLVVVRRKLAEMLAPPPVLPTRRF